MLHPIHIYPLLFQNILFNALQKFLFTSRSRILKYTFFVGYVSHQNKTRDNMLNLLNEASVAIDNSDAYCFLCVVMSHGTRKTDGGLGVVCFDGEIIEIEAETCNDMTFFVSCRAS